MKQKLLTLFAALLCSMSLFAFDVHIGDFYYNLDAEKQTAEVTYYINYSLYSKSGYNLDNGNCKYPITTADIPASVEHDGITYAVTRIGAHAFENCTQLETVSIPTSVTSVGSDAFKSCSKLPVIDKIRYADTYLVGAVDRNLGTYSIQEGTRWIGNGAFSECTNMTSLTIPNSVTDVGNYAFRGCVSIASPIYNAHVFAFMPTSWSGPFVIPDGITSIASAAFSQCTGLTSVTIPDGVTRISAGAFSGCSGLTSVSLPNSVTEIEASAFAGCTALPAITLPANLESIGKSVFMDCRSLTSITVPNSVTTIGSSAFEGCGQLTSVELSNSITEIPEHLFVQCSSLSSLTIPEGVTTIGDGAFNFCYSLNTITIPASVTQIGGTSVYRNVYYNTNECLPPAEVFYGCSGLTSINVDANNHNFSSIDGVVFRESELCIFPCGRKTYTVPEGVTMIGEMAFAGCELTSLVIPESVTRIHIRAFKDVIITSLSIGGSIRYERDAFKDCEIEEMHIPDIVTWCGSGFEYTMEWHEVWGFWLQSNPLSYTKHLYVNGELVRDLVIPDGVQMIEMGTFHNAPLFSVTIPNSVTLIRYSGGSMYYDNAKYETFTNIPILYYNGTAPGAPWGAKCVNGYAEDYLVYSDADKTELVYCARDAKGVITIPSSVTRIAHGAFIEEDEVAYYYDLTGIRIPELAAWCNIDFDDAGTNPLAIVTAQHVYVGNNEVTTLSIPDGVTAIKDYAFCGFRGLTSVTLPNSVTSIGQQAFNGCYRLNSINIPNSITDVGKYAFNGCTSLPVIDNIRYAETYLVEAVDKTLNSYSTKAGTRWIADKAFYNCRQATSITIPKSVQRIGEYAFADCKSLEAIVIPEGVPEIEDKTFDGCSSLQSITIPNSVTEIGEYAFAGCRALSSITIPNNVTDIDYRAFYNVPHIEYYGTATGAPWGALAMNGKNYEVYTVYNDWRQVLTYYYDDQRESRTGVVTELYDPNAVRFADYHDKVRTVYIDQSMLDAPLTSMEKMFYGGFSKKPLYLSKMTSIEGLENLNTENVTSMQSMFEGCQSLTELDLSTFNTANVTSTNCMFQSCSNLETLNISLFNIGKMEDMRYMFSGCSKLKTIYCKTDWSTSGAQSNYMFSGCSALEGGEGTPYVNSMIDNTFARPDDLDNDKPGYFTVIESVAVTIGAREWATFVVPYALDFSAVDGLTAYIITGHTGSTVETVEVSDVPANTPVLLNGSANTYSIPVIAGSATDVSGNKLVAGTGAKVAAEAGKTKYVLSTEADDVVFKIITETPATVAKSKAYLMFDEVVESRQLTFGHDVTGIESSPESSFEGKNLWYDLQGRRLEGMPTRKGLYIVNGKKYLVK